MFIACLTIFSSILSSLQEVSYVKVHVYCVFDFFHFNLVSTSVGELRESACLLCVCFNYFFFNLYCGFLLFKSLLQAVSYVKVHVYCVFDYFLFNLVSTSGGELRESACLLCVWLFSLQSCLHFSAGELFNHVSTSGGELRKMKVYCVFDYFLLILSLFSEWVTWSACLLFKDYFLFNLVSTSGCELRGSACLLCVWLFSLNLVSTSGCELRESACLLCVWQFCLQSCLHFSRWVT